MEVNRINIKLRILQSDDYFSTFNGCLEFLKYKRFLYFVILKAATVQCNLEHFQNYDTKMPYLTKYMALLSNEVIHSNIYLIIGLLHAIAVKSLYKKLLK